MSRRDAPTSPPPRPQGAWGLLRRHLAVLIALKLALITLLYALFFNPARRPAIDAEAVGRQLQSSPVSSPER
jgi:hypothetical protein